MLFGDSLTVAIATPLQRFFDARNYNINIINAGVGGNTTGDGKNRLEATLTQYHPDIIVLALGGNDVLNGIPPSITYDNLDFMLATLKTKNIPVVLSAVQSENLGHGYNPFFNDIYSSLASKYNIDLYPFFLSGIYNNKELMLPDGIHPNAKGVDVIVQKLGPYLIKKISRENNGTLGHAVN